MARKTRTMPAFFEVLQKGQMVFEPAYVVAKDPELRGQVIARSLAEAEAWATAGTPKAGEIVVTPQRGATQRTMLKSSEANERSQLRAA